MLQDIKSSSRPQKNSFLSITTSKIIRDGLYCTSMHAFMTEGNLTKH